MSVDKLLSLVKALMFLKCHMHSLTSSVWLNTHIAMCTIVDVSPLLLKHSLFLCLSNFMTSFFLYGWQILPQWLSFYRSIETANKREAHMPTAIINRNCRLNCLRVKRHNTNNKNSIDWTNESDNVWFETFRWVGCLSSLGGRKLSNEIGNRWNMSNDNCDFIRCVCSHFSTVDSLYWTAVLTSVRIQSP